MGKKEPSLFFRQTPFENKTFLEPCKEEQQAMNKSWSHSSEVK